MQSSFFHKGGVAMTTNEIIAKRLTLAILFFMLWLVLSIFIQIILANRDQAQAAPLQQPQPPGYLPGNDVNLVINIMECESGGRYNVVGDDGVSVGIVQFQKATFNEFKRRANMPKAVWKNPIDQLRLMVWMLNNGYGKHWTCYRTLVAMD